MTTPQQPAKRELDARVAVEVMGWTLTAPVDPACGHSVGVNRDGSSAKRNFVHDGTREIVLPAFASDVSSSFLVVEKMRGEGLEDEFIAALLGVVDAFADSTERGCVRGIPRSELRSFWRVLTATPAQICEAALACQASLKSLESARGDT